MNAANPMTSSGARPDDRESRLSIIVERCRDLHLDVDLAAVRAWKSANPGGKAVGSLPIYVPSELIHAAGALPVGLIGGGDHIDVVRGDAYFQSYICHLPRSFVEMGLSHRLDSLDGLLFPAICVIRNLSGVSQMLFDNHLVRFVDFPQNFDAGVGGWFYHRQLLDLAADLGTLTGREVTAGRLAGSIALYNRNRHLIRELHRRRCDAPAPVATTEAYLLQRAGHLLPV
ncbi:MAG: 2-hydroxyacyl-CoA dehydratase, partial [Acidobacteriota bacterium]